MTRSSTNKETPIQHFMTPTPISIGRQQTLEEASHRMQEHNIRHLPVLDGGRLVGILSDRDIEMVEALPNIEANTTTVEEAMVPDPYTVTPETPLIEVVARMAARKYGTAVVTDKNGFKLLGIFTTVDSLRAFADVLGAA
jgi:acetoin utilization protein AcuB